MRYFAELSYKGTNYNGWQRQPNAPSVQQTIEEKLSMIIRKSITVMGCGRTDSGVHASQFYLHFDLPEEHAELTLNVANEQHEFSTSLVNRMNKALPPDIAFRRVLEVEENAHTRFDAESRAYEYHVIFEKNPFMTEQAFFYPTGHRLDFEKMQAAANVLLQYDSFFPFCKTHSDAKTMLCKLTRAEWVWEKEGTHLVFHIASNRFLRGMVRLIVGMCLNVGMGKTSIEEVIFAMENETRLKKSYSVPPNGLFLSEVKYDYVEDIEAKF